MEFIVLTPKQVDLAAARFVEHGNAPGQIERHFLERGEPGTARLLRALRAVELRFEIDLGTVCHKFLETEAGPTPQVQRAVMQYVARWNRDEEGERRLLVSIDRAREIDRLADGDIAWSSSLES